MFFQLALLRGLDYTVIPKVAYQDAKALALIVPSAAMNSSHVLSF